MSSSDRELLELAAKAYGDPSVSAKADGPFHTRVIGYCDVMNCDVFTQWNPLTDDGDALRIAVSLSFRVYVYSGGGDDCTVVAGDELTSKKAAYITEPHNADSLAATRRAIVRAAAEIGRLMP